MEIRCSRCNSKITDLVFRVDLKIIPSQITKEGLLRPFPNTGEGTSEMLCKECFEKYCDCLDALNKTYEEDYLANMVEIIDDIQYDL